MSSKILFRMKLVFVAVLVIGFVCSDAFSCDIPMPKHKPIPPQEDPTVPPPLPEPLPDVVVNGDNVTEREPIQGSNDQGHDANKPAGNEQPVGAMDTDPVYLKTGEHYFHCRDLVIHGQAMDIAIERSYRSNSEYNGCFGYGWDINYNMKVRRLSSDSTKIILLDGENSKKEYTYSGSNKYVRSVEPDNYIKYESPNFVLYKKDGTKLHFDSTGNLSEIEDRLGNIITFEYYSGLQPVYGHSEFSLDPAYGGPADGNNIVAMMYKIKSITDDSGRKINFTYYDPNGLLSTITDFENRTWQYYYDSANNLRLVISPGTDESHHIVTKYTYADAHRLVSVTDSDNQTWLENTYSDSRVTSQEYGDGTFALSYKPTGNEATVTDRKGFKHKTVYNSFGNIVSRTIYTSNPNSDPNQFTTGYRYNSKGQLTREILPAGNCVDYTYDTTRGNLTGVYRKTKHDDPNDRNNTNVIATTYTYTNYTAGGRNLDLVKTITDPRDYVTTFTYDFENSGYQTHVGNLMQITYPTAGSQTPTVKFTYYTDEDDVTYGKVKTMTDPNGMVTKYQYYTDANDGFEYRYGRVKSVTVDANTTSGLNITAQYDYDVLGRVSEANDPNGAVTAFVYNAFDKLVKMTTPTGGVTHYTYNDCKKLSEIERDITGEPNQVAGFTYDILDHLKTITDPLGYITTNSYDLSENISSLMDAEGKNASPQYKTNCEYNERDLLWKVTDANGGITEYSYDKNGNLAKIKDAKGRETSYKYDGFDRTKCITYPDDTNEVFGYDKNSNITSNRNRNWQTITYAYDSLNRMTSKTRQGESAITYTYDVASRLKNVNNNGDVTEYYYDRINRITDVNDPDKKLVSYEYDKRGLRTELIYPDDSYVTYEYDPMARLKRIKYNGDTVAQYKYDELSRRTLITLGNDANAAYHYNIGDRLTRLDNKASSTHLVFDYTYDKVGNRKTMKVDNNSNNTHSYTYDKIYRLTIADYPGSPFTDYYYDPVGNRRKINESGTETGYTQNNEGLNQYGSVGSLSYSYDDNGNLTNDGTYKYYYDCENRLIDVNNQSNQQVASYEYDYLGRRVKKTVYGSPNVVTKYVYDGDRVVAEYNGTGTLLRSYVYGTGIDEVICMVTSSGTYYYHYDGLGSVIAISDDEGNIVEKYSYDVFGKPTIRDAQGNIISTSAYGNRFMFTGREYDYETGNYYYRARYYNPTIGRFLQPDPVGCEAGLNFYTYCDNNPINLVDPWGEASIGTTPAMGPVGWLGQAAYGDTRYSGHWQILYDDGSNSGYFGGNSWFGLGGSPVFGTDRNRTARDYRTIVNNLNDELLRQAERNVQSRWRNENRRFRPVNNSCQTYIIEAYREYRRLEKEQKNEQKQKQEQEKENKKGSK